MDEWERLCSHAHTESRVVSRLQGSGLLALMKDAVMKAVVKPSVQIGEVEKTVYDAIENTSLLVHLKNTVYKELFNILEEGTDPDGVPAHIQKEPVTFIRQAQEKWEGKLKQAINKLCSSYKVSLSMKRPSVQQEILRKKWNSIGADYPELGRFHPIFGPKDFMSVVMHVRDPNYIPSPRAEGEKDQSGQVKDPAAGIMQASINVKSLFKLREQFKSLHPSRVQMESGSPEYLEKSNNVVKNGLWSLAKELCKTGCVITHRRELWCRTLAVNTTDSEHAFSFEALKSEVLKHILVFEKLLVNDVKKTAANDDNYFVFEDIMHQVLLCFLHDSSLIQHYEHLSPTPFAAYLEGHEEEPDHETWYPPNGIVPFHGFSLYMAPLCFLFDRPDHLYALFKQLYLRYFIHLHSISSSPQGILSLCCQFECLLQCREPELFKHLNHIGAQPLSLAFFWLMSAFSGYLDSREVLLLWDRVIGFNSLIIIAVMAVAIFEFRATNLFKATKQNEAEDILSDLRCIKVLPLLQQTLFL